MATRAASVDSRVVATERLCCAIAAIIKDPDFSLDTPRMVLAKETAQQLLDASLSVDDSRREVFTSFALKLDKKLCEIATPSNNKKVSKLDNLIKDPLFLEYINETLMTEHVKKSFEAVVQTVEVPKGRRLQYTLYLRPRPGSKCNQWIKTA